MRITCPNCEAEYEVPASLLKPGRLVGCARCKKRWLPVAEDSAEDSAAAGDAIKPPPDQADTERHVGPETFASTVAGVTAMDRLVAAAAPMARPPTLGLMAAWVATGLVLGSACIGAVVWHDAVIRAWPPSAWILAPIARLLGF